MDRPSSPCSSAMAPPSIRSGHFKDEPTVTAADEQITLQSRSSLHLCEEPVDPNSYLTDGSATPLNDADISSDPSRASSYSESKSSLESASSSTVTPQPDSESFIPRISTLRRLLAHIGGALTLFLATTDATIISTSLPTIASDLDASDAQYIWVGTAYMLTQTAFQPLYGKISDIVGRKNLLYASISIFALGSLLCGISLSINMLIASRALAGIGGGGIVSCVWVITTDIVEVRHRPKWSLALSVTWSCSAIAGPLLGGVFSGSSSNTVNWRWCFYLNLPVCLIGILILSLALRGVQVNRCSVASYTNLLQEFDFGGLILFMGGTCCIVVGFSFATTYGWNSRVAIALITTGLFILVCGAVYEKHTSRDCLFPPTMFKNRTAVTILVIAFLHNVAFNAGTFYLALFYQAADGLTPLQSGVQMLSYSLGASIASMPAAWFINEWQKRKRDTSGQNLTIKFGLLISAVGFGLLILLDENSHMVLQNLFPVIAGIGIGLLFHSPYQVFIKALQSAELATGTGGFFLVRFTGATVGIAVAGAVFDGRMASRIPPESGLDILGSSIDYGQLKSIVPTSLRDELLHLVSTSIQTVWVFCTPVLGLAFIMSFLLEKQPLGDEDLPIDEKKASQAQQSPVSTRV